VLPRPLLLLHSLASRWPNSRTPPSTAHPNLAGPRSPLYPNRTYQRARLFAQVGRPSEHEVWFVAHPRARVFILGPNQRGDAPARGPAADADAAAATTVARCGGPPSRLPSPPRAPLPAPPRPPPSARGYPSARAPVARGLPRGSPAAAVDLVSRLLAFDPRRRLVAHLVRTQTLVCWCTRTACLPARTQPACLPGRNLSFRV